ncbi:hypothetical protein MB901379_00977 [Mycobacterium basiliense]|uniref:DUF2510 domain-containing protein n=1 Tax=Mycobacterium basiliense TaxID=2094119 RepID=A0A3S4BCK0_9MYCO|nr:DUF2510 domain-containing protein [Mycobacterium basiliense]VDM87435.1 hypothetical protein MB901379_00977 [Mycobacterium basiliense]
MQNSGDRFYLKLIRHTGIVLLWQQQTYTVTGTLQDCEAAYRSAQRHNLLGGWWSLTSLLAFNWVALISNFNAIRRLRTAAEVPAARQLARPAPTPAQPPMASTPAGWYRDPAGSGQRYWDGVAWTHWTHPPSHR